MTDTDIMQAIAITSVAMVIPTIIISFVIVALYIVCMWKLFEKAGYHGWKALIPVYNIYILSQMASCSIVILILCLIPVTCFIGAIIIAINLGKSFGWSTGKSLLLLVFLNCIGYIMLAFGSDFYVGANPGNDLE